MKPEWHYVIKLEDLKEDETVGVGIELTPRGPFLEMESIHVPRLYARRDGFDRIIVTINEDDIK
jgi:hypothetical protein